MKILREYQSANVLFRYIYLYSNTTCINGSDNYRFREFVRPFINEINVKHYLRETIVNPSYVGSWLT